MGTPHEDLSEPLAGDALDPYKSPVPKECWWCGEATLSREHKFKASDLRRMSDVEQGGVMWGDGESLRAVRSVRKSAVVRFRANLCARCNNQRSQPFDHAYDKFSDYLWTNQDGLWRRRYLDLADIYGSGWPTQSLELARYIAKHIACRMVHDGFAAPPGTAAFLDGEPVLTNVHMVLFKDRALYGLYRRGLREGCDARGLWLGPANGAVSRSRRRLTMYSSSMAVGGVGVMYRWDEDCTQIDPFYFYRRARLHQRHRLPAV